MVEIHRGEFKPLQCNAAYWSSHLKQAVAICNGLTWVSKNMLVGDDLDRKLFKMVEAHFAVRNYVRSFILFIHSKRMLDRLSRPSFLFAGGQLLSPSSSILC